MAELVKWLTRRIVAPVCMGSIPIFRPIKIIKTLNFQRFSLFIRVLSTLFNCFVNRILIKMGLYLTKTRPKARPKKQITQCVFLLSKVSINLF